MPKERVISNQMEAPGSEEFDYLTGSPSVQIDCHLFHRFFECDSGKECLDKVIHQFDLFEESNPQASLFIQGSFYEDQLIALLSDENAELKIHTSSSFNYSAACKLHRGLLTKLRLDEWGFEWGEQPLISFFRNPSDANRVLDLFDQPLNDREWKVFGSPAECWMMIQAKDGCILYRHSA